MGDLTVSYSLHISHSCHTGSLIPQAGDQAFAGLWPHQAVDRETWHRPREASSGRSADSASDSRDQIMIYSWNMGIQHQLDTNKMGNIDRYLKTGHYYYGKLGNVSNDVEIEMGHWL